MKGLAAHWECHYVDPKKGARHLKSIKKAVIPAAGYGTRFLPITKVVPKELLPIGNKPAIHYVVEEAVRSGIEEVILVCHPSKNGIIDYFQADPDLHAFLEKRGKREEMAAIRDIESMANFKVVYQKEPLGLGHAVWCARKEIGDNPFLVMLPDVLISDTIPAAKHLIDACEGGDEWGILVERVTPSEIPSYGIARIDRIKDKACRLTGAVEKPKASEAPSDLAILGRYLLPAEIFDYLEELKTGALGEIQLTDAVDQLAGKRPGFAVMTRGEIFDIGTPEGLREAYQFFDEAVGRSSRMSHSGRMKVLRRH